MSNSEQRDSWLNSGHWTLDADRKALGGRGATTGKVKSKKRGEGNREKETGEESKKASGGKKGMEENGGERGMEKRGETPERSGLLS